MVELLPRSARQRRALAASAATPAEILGRLFEESPSEGVKRALATNVSTPPVVLACLARAIDQRIRTAVAKNTSTPAGAIAVLANASASKVRIAALLNPVISTYLADAVTPSSSSPVGVWPQTVSSAVAVLLSDGGAALAENSGYRAAACPPEALAVLSHSQITELRALVARDHQTDASTLDFLARSAGDELRSAVARNRNTSVSTLDYLGNQIVGRGQYAFNVQLFLMAEGVAVNPNTAPQTLGTLAKNGTRRVRELVARNTRTPPEVLSALARDDSMAVIESVAGNPSSPPNALTALSAIALDVKENFFGFAVSSNHTVQVKVSDLDRVFDSVTTWASVAACVAQNPSTPISTLTKLAEHGYDEYVSKNPSAPPDLRAPS